MNSDSAGFAPARLRIAAFASLGQCDGNGLLDRFFLCRRMAGANRSILFPVIHQCLDIAADDRLAGSFSERHDFPPVCRINWTRFPPVCALQPDRNPPSLHRAIRHAPVRYPPRLPRVCDDHAPFIHWVRNGQQQLDAAASATNRPAQCAGRARGNVPTPAGCSDADTHAPKLASITVALRGTSRDYRRQSPN